MLEENGDDGNEVEDDTLYNTLYRYFVLFGVPEWGSHTETEDEEVTQAIEKTLLTPKPNDCLDRDVFIRDQEKFSLSKGTDERIANARRRLEKDDAMELLLSLVSFDPKTRAKPSDVINSRFMSTLIEDDAVSVIQCDSDIIKTYIAGDIGK